MVFVLFVFVFVVIDIIFVFMFFKETLLENKRVNILDLIEKIVNVCISVVFLMLWGVVLLIV